jgi:hypothetical protein
MANDREAFAWRPKPVSIIAEEAKSGLPPSESHAIRFGLITKRVSAQPRREHIDSPLLKLILPGCDLVRMDIKLLS